MRGLASIPLLSLLVLSLGLSGCAGTQALVTGTRNSPASLPEVIAATDLIQAGQVLRLAAALGPPTDDIAAGSVAVTLDEAANGLIGDAAVLKAGISRPHATAAELRLALPSLQALQAGYAAAGPGQAAQAGRARGYLDAFLAVTRSYDADAGAASLPQASLPGH